MFAIGSEWVTRHILKILSTVVHVVIQCRCKQSQHCGNDFETFLLKAEHSTGSIDSMHYLRLYKRGKYARNGTFWLDSIFCTAAYVLMAIFLCFFFGCFPYWEKLILYLHSIDTGFLYLFKTLAVVDDLILMLCGCTRIICMRHILLCIRNGFFHSLSHSLPFSLSRTSFRLFLCFWWAKTPHLNQSNRVQLKNGISFHFFFLNTKKTVD